MACSLQKHGDLLNSKCGETASPTRSPGLLSIRGYQTVNATANVLLQWRLEYIVHLNAYRLPNQMEKLLVEKALILDPSIYRFSDPLSVDPRPLL